LKVGCRMDHSDCLLAYIPSLLYFLNNFPFGRLVVVMNNLLLISFLYVSSNP
jgi:hypothetical protein